MSLHNNRFVAVTVGAGVLVAASSLGAVAANLVTSADIKDQTIKKVDIGKAAVGSQEVKDESLKVKDLRDQARAKLRGNTGPAGARGPAGPAGPAGLSALEADGPYPGLTDLGNTPGQGDNSDELVVADAAVSQTVWVQCAPGKVALGGGFRLAADSTLAAAQAIDVLASEPGQVVNGVLTPSSIPGDAAGSILPNAWVVEVVNRGTTAEVVRPWVVCAKVG